MRLRMKAFLTCGGGSFVNLQLGGSLGPVEGHLVLEVADDHLVVVVVEHCQWESTGQVFESFQSLKGMKHPRTRPCLFHHAS